MDRNSIIGFVLIFVLVIVYFIYNKGQIDQQNEQRKRIQDSLAMVQKEDSIARSKLPPDTVYIPQQANNKTVISVDSVAADSIAQAQLSAQYGPFTQAATGEEKLTVIENEKIKVTLTNQGGKIYSVEVKDYVTFKQTPVVLFEGGQNNFGIGMPVGQNFIRTDSLYFNSDGEGFRVEGDDEQTISFTLKASEDVYLTQSYTLGGNSNFVQYKLTLKGFDKLVSNRETKLTLNWETFLNLQEREMSNERTYTTIYYRSAEDDDVDYISERKNVDDERIKYGLKWISYKQQFFNSSLIADEKFLSASLWTYAPDDDDDTSGYLKRLASKLYLPYASAAEADYNMRFYFGPNGYNNLKKYDLGLEEMVPLGSSFLGFINKTLILPVFNFFERFTSSYGLIILLLAIFIKIILSPLTFKSYKSTAKMRVLKPEIDELKEKYKGDAQKLQMEQMKLYRKTGVSMFGGCLPMLLQFPILISMYRFFPGAIHLRQASFLWAEDLSTYDSILSIPDIPFYGDHVSLFTILMAVTSILYTKVNSQMSPTAGAGQMKFMMYFMPFFLVFIFNSLPAGLTYYYLLYNVLSFAQQWLFKKFFINEDALRAQIEAKRKQPAKKSKWQMRLEEMQKAQEKQRRNRGRR